METNRYYHGSGTETIPSTSTSYAENHGIEINTGHLFRRNQESIPCIDSTSFINPARYIPDTDDNLNQSRNLPRRPHEGVEELLQGLHLFNPIQAAVPQEPDVYARNVSNPSPIDWEVRNSSWRSCFQYFFTDCCPPSTSDSSSDFMDDRKAYQNKRVRQPPDKPPDIEQSFLDPARYQPESQYTGKTTSSKTDYELKQSCLRKLWHHLCPPISDKILRDDYSSIPVEMTMDQGLEEECEHQLKHLLIRRDVMCHDLAQLDLHIKERELKVMEEEGDFAPNEPFWIDVCLINFMKRLCFKEQRGGGGDTSESSSTCSTSSNESAPVDIILTQMRKTRKRLKKELADVDRGIAFVKKFEKKKKHRKHTTESIKPSESSSAKQSCDIEGIPPKKKKKMSECKEDHDISITDGFFDESFEGAMPDAIKNDNINSDSQKLEKRKDNSDKVPPGNTLFVGQTFSNFQSFEKAQQDYCRNTFTIIAKDKCDRNHSTSLSQIDYPYKRVVYACIHQGKIKSKPKDGSRPNQSYNAMGCEFRLGVSLNVQTKMYKVTKFQPMHTGHVPTQVAFKQHRNQNRLSKEEEDLFIGHYKENLGLKSRKVRDEILKKTGKLVNVKRLLRIVQTRRGEEGGLKEMDLLLRELNSIQDNDSGAKVTIAYTDSGEQQFVEDGKHIIKIVHIQTSSMTKRLQDHPNLILFDGTYNLCNFTVMLIHVVDQHWKTKLCSVLMVSNETKEVINEALTIFENNNTDVLKQLQYHIVDKDFVEIECATCVFKNSQLILCQYHCRKAVDRKISEISLPAKHQYLKKELKNLFNTMLVSLSRQDYLKAWSDMYELSLKHTGLNKFYKYMNTNWHQHAESWAACHLKNYQLYENFTNNRSENFNQQLKQRIEKQSPPHLVVKEIISMDKFQSLDSVEADLKSTEKVYHPTTANVHVQEVLTTGKGWLSLETLKRLKAQCEESDDVSKELIYRHKGQLSCTSMTGPCLFSSNNSLPCKHLFKTRRLNGESLLTKKMVSKQWHVSPSVKNQDDEKERATGKRLTFLKRNLLARHAKFKSSSNVIKELPASLAQYPEKERHEKVEVLEQHMNMALNAINNNMKSVFEDDGVKFVNQTSKTSPCTMHHDKFKFIYSPKKKNRSYCTGGDSSDQRRKNSQRSARRAIQLPLNEWQTSVINFQRASGSTCPFGQLEFDVLTNLNLTGFRAFITDSHFENFMILLRLSFPEIQSLQPTSLYEFKGFSSIDPTKTFLQPVHSGGAHWTLLSNIGLSDAEKASGCKILHFDSFVHLNDTNSQALIPSAVTWQAAQLLKKEHAHDVCPIEIVTVPTHQQDNGHDCGLFVMGTMMALASGLDPTKIVYKGNMRTQLLDMFKANKVQMFEYENRDNNGPNRGKFTVPSGGRLKKSVLLQEMKTSFEIICYCQHPRSWDNIIICDLCHSETHQRCALIGPSVRGPGIADAIQNFVCFDCRKSGQYSIGFSVNDSPDHEAIDTMSSKIESLQDANLASLYGTIINNRKPLPSRLKDFRLMESIYQKFDLNALCEGKGPIFVAISNFWSNHLKDLDETKEFSHLSQGQKIYLALILICLAGDLELPPIHVSYQDISSGDDLSNVIKENKKWIHTLEHHCEYLGMQMRKLKQLPKNSGKAREYESFLTRQLTELENFAEVLQQSLRQCNESKATINEKSWKEKAITTCQSIREQTAITTDELDLYLRQSVLSYQ